MLKGCLYLTRPWVWRMSGMDGFGISLLFVCVCVSLCVLWYRDIWGCVVFTKEIWGLQLGNFNFKEPKLPLVVVVSFCCLNLKRQLISFSAFGITQTW